ncbi:uncharacterized protein LOC112499953 [Cynara cardunculus var. scolymus]|uniref:uncharacterized protein LOC112499953 n=1 Tax=Cynara cardunculus var. scolymus TaxID=59895 RepID=UPI000D623E60|nr:uncharacterized protein LOC112499953 [Cynara cardunculus var. scolymus]
MAGNSQHFSMQGDLRRGPQKINDVNTGTIESMLFDLTNLVKQLVVGKKQVKACGIWNGTNHPTDACPQLQEDVLVAPEDVNAIGGFPSQQPQKRTVPDPEAKARRSERKEKKEAEITGDKSNENKVEGKNIEDKEKKPELVIRPPFPNRFEQTKKEQEDKEIMETFCRVEELCTNKKKLTMNEKVSMGENVSAMLQGEKMPPKCKDPDKVMLDLGTSINVMPYSIYSSLNVGPLKRTEVVIQLVHRSIVYPNGILEDVLVQINELVFTTDFYVIDMEKHHTSKSPLILLGRPFLKTSKTKIDVHDGTLTMEFDGEVITFNIYDAIRYPSDVSYVSFVDVLDLITHDLYDLTNRDLLEVAITRHLDARTVNLLMKEYDLGPELKEMILAMEYN